MGNSSSSAVGCNFTVATTTNNLHGILNQMMKQTSTNSTAQDWIENAIAANVIPMDDLIAKYAEWRDSHGKAISILRSTSAITSVISSSIFIWMIMRSHERLSTTQHRLLLGLCICDITLSSSLSTFNSHSPHDDDYITWNAKGNQHTCTAQGFFVMVGAYGGLFYNASLNLYFLAVVKYKKSDEFIRAKIEPFLHAVPFAVALCYSIYLLVKKHYNADMFGNCITLIHVVPHCYGFDKGEIREGFEIPCWRGIEGALTSGISYLTLIFIPILIIIVSLGVIYSAVRTQEKKLAKYGIGSLRSDLQQQSVSTQQSSGVLGRMGASFNSLLASLKSRKSSYRNTNRPVTRSNNLQSQSRAVMHKAFGYSFAWFLSYGCFLIGAIVFLATGLFPLVLNYLATIFAPLQGFFNLLIFMQPRIMAAKKSKKQGGESVSWCHAFSTAFWSKGKGIKNQGTARSNLRRGTSNAHQEEKIKNEEALSDNLQSPMFGRIKKKKKTKRADTVPQEEEKCEIQVPDNLNPIKTKAAATYAPNILPSPDTTTTMCTVNRVKKVDFDDNINVGNALSDVVEDADEDVMSNDDEEEEVEEAREENVDIVSTAAWMK